MAVRVKNCFDTLEAVLCQRHKAHPQVQQRLRHELHGRGREREREEEMRKEKEKVGLDERSLLQKLDKEERK